MSWIGPRERYTVEGPEAFGDADLLALVLGTGAGGRGARHIAAELLERFQGLDGLARAPVDALTAVPGVGQARAVRVHAACVMARRARAVAVSRVAGPHEAWRYLRPRMEGLDHEELFALYLSRSGAVRAARRVSSGGTAYTIVEPRQVLQPAVALGCAAVLLAHNHPSGDPEPSDADLACTHRVAAAAQILDLQLLDHLVIGDGCYVSMAERGVLPGWSTTPLMLTRSPR